MLDKHRDRWFRAKPVARSSSSSTKGKNTRASAYQYNKMFAPRYRLKQTIRKFAFFSLSRISGWQQIFVG
jgi:hypothetical protein